MTTPAPETRYLLSTEAAAALRALRTPQAHPQDPPTQFACGVSSIPDHPELWLGSIVWAGYWRMQEDFEALPGVTPLGDPWDPVPAAAVAPLQALADGHHGTRVSEGRTHGKAAPTVAVADTVARALRKAGQHQ